MLGGLAAHAEHLLHHFHDVVLEKQVVRAIRQPVAAVDAGEGGAKLVGLALAFHELLHAGELQVLPVEAQMLVEHAGEGEEQGRLRLGATLPLAALGIDVEQDGLGGNGGGALHAGVHHGVGHLAVEELHGGNASHLAVREQMAEHLQEVRFAAAEEAGYPHAHFVGRHVQGAIVGLEEIREMALQLVGNHILGELLLNGGGVVLGHLDDAVDGAVDVLGEELADLHERPSWIGGGWDRGVRRWSRHLEQVECSVVVAVF